MLKKGKMKGKQKGSAVKVKKYTRNPAGPKKRSTVKAHRRGKPGGKRG